jgi:hypothetical protein
VGSLLSTTRETCTDGIDEALLISDLRSFQDNPLRSEIGDLRSGDFLPESG